MKSVDGKWAHTFASDNDFWRWTYVFVMDGMDSVLALQSGSV